MKKVIEPLLEDLQSPWLSESGSERKLRHPSSYGRAVAFPRIQGLNKVIILETSMGQIANFSS